jgi:SAM-dependent methyltransferase
MDFAPQMIERAKQAVAASGLGGRDIDLLVADMTKPPLSDRFADVVISNCVINLCPDKEGVYREAFRILRPGGRLAISDIVMTEEIDAELRECFRASWAGCLGGAIPEGLYLAIVKRAGFDDVEIVARHVLTPAELEAMACCPGKDLHPGPAPEDLALVQQ